jgi:hypothetical protein
MDDFMYIIPEHNPLGPQVPGAPGLLFECDELLCEQAERARIRRLFIRIKSGGIALWIYLGQYNIEAAASLTKEEWVLQKTSVRIPCLHDKVKLIQSSCQGQKQVGKEDMWRELGKKSADSNHASTTTRA